MEAISALRHIRRGSTHLGWEIEIGVGTLYVARARASAKGSCRLRDHTARGESPPKHSASILKGRTRGRRLLDLRSILDRGRTVGSNSAWALGRHRPKRGGGRCNLRGRRAHLICSSLARSDGRLLS